MSRYMSTYPGKEIPDSWFSLSSLSVFIGRNLYYSSMDVFVSADCTPTQSTWWTGRNAGLSEESTEPRRGSKSKSVLSHNAVIAVTPRSLWIVIIAISGYGSLCVNACYTAGKTCSQLRPKSSPGWWKVPPAEVVASRWTESVLFFLSTELMILFWAELGFINCIKWFWRALKTTLTPKNTLHSARVCCSVFHASLIPLPAAV